MDSIDFVNMNLIDMDCIHVVPNNRLPDESYIERLFPKCSPKQDIDSRNNQDNNGDDSSPTKTNNNNSNKHRRRRRLRARKPKQTMRDQLASTSNNSNDINIKNNNANTTNITNLPNLNSNAPGSTTGLNSLPSRPSILQFNTLSDADSDPEDRIEVNPSTLTNISLDTQQPPIGHSFSNQRLDANETSATSTTITSANSINTSDTNNNNNNNNNKNNNNNSNDQKTHALSSQVISTIISASIFPRLDEGLSSDAVDSDGDIPNNGEVSRLNEDLAEADDEDDELVTKSTRSKSNRTKQGQEHQQRANTKVPIRSATRASLNRLANSGLEGIANNKSNTSTNLSTNNRPSSDTDIETDRLLGTQRQKMHNDKRHRDVMFSETNNSSNTNDLHQSTSLSSQKTYNNNGSNNGANFREVLIEGVLFHVKYLGSTHSDCEGRGEKEDRINQAEMAVHEVKLRNCETNQAIDVQLFISTEKIMVLNDRHRKLLMDHSLRTISYIADIGEAIVLIVKTKSSGSSTTLSDNQHQRGSRISCHVFESSESHTITKSISQAFQVAYTELLKANGSSGGSGSNGNIADLTNGSSYPHKELDYQQVLNSQEMSTEELEMFSRRENQREVIVPKQVGEIIGLSIVESGWGSVLPTVVIANIKQDGPADKCKKLSVGYQILSVNGISLVGLPLAECQEILRKTKQQSVARLSVVPGPITVEVKIKRPDTKYQLGFSVQNGVICSLLRGGIAERGGVRVGHRIMSINGTTVVGAPHDKIVNMLANSVGEIRMITCLTSLYKLILGEEKPIYF